MTLQHHGTTCCSTLEPRSRLSLSLQPRSRRRRVDVHMATVKQTGLRTSVYLPSDLHGCDDVSQARTTADSRSPCGHPRHPLAFSRASRQQATLLSPRPAPQHRVPFLFSKEPAARSFRSVGSMLRDIEPTVVKCASSSVAPPRQQVSGLTAHEQQHSRSELARLPSISALASLPPIDGVWRWSYGAAAG